MSTLFAKDHMIELANLLVSLSKHCSARRPLGSTLDSYVIQTIGLPTVSTLAGLAVLLLTKDLLSFADFIINRGFGVRTVAMIAGYELVPILSRALPFAVFIGSLIGLGRLKRDLEILAMEAAGLSKWSLVVPVLAFTMLVTSVGLPLSLFLGPWADRALDATLHQLTVTNPGLALRPGVVREFSGVKLLAHAVTARGDQLRGVLLWTPKQRQILFAQRGEFTPQPDGVMQLVLSDGIMLPLPHETGEGTHFASFIQPLHDDPVPVRRNDSFLTGAPLEEVTALAWTKTEDPDLAQRAQLEWHRRFSYPLASLCFGLLAAPLALLGQRFSGAAGGVVGILATLLYYGLVQLGDGLVQNGLVRAGFGVWLPNIIVSLVAGGLLWRGISGGTGKQRAGNDTANVHGAPDHSALRLRSPRYILPRYVARTYLSMLGLSFAVLLTGYLLVDVLERLQWFARYHASLPKALYFYSLWIPLLASRVMPMTMLLAASLTMSSLNVHRELIAMRACGISALRALVPIVCIAGVIMPAYFVLNEVILPRTTARVDEFKNREIKNRAPVGGPIQQLLWWRTERQIYQAEQLDPQLGEAQEVSIYNLGANGLPTSRIDARSARHIGNGVWELVEPVRTEIAEPGGRETLASSRVQLGAAPKETFASTHLSVWELARKIREAEATGYDMRSYRVDFHAKLAAPVACVLLPAVALFFALSGPPSLGPTVTVLLSSLLGVGYMLMTSVCTSLGYGGVLPSSVAGWVPPLFLVMLASACARRN